MTAPPTTEEPQNFKKRDVLVETELAVQARWEAVRAFEVDAPAPGDELKPEKYMVTAPYPYMNGVLHLGHSFTFSKPDFAVGYQRLKGKRTLFPFGFHCTGMPIKACADKLRREIDLFGPDFAGFQEEGPDAAASVAAAAENSDAPVTPVPDSADPPADAPAAVADGGKTWKKKGKLAAKTSTLKYQFQIMRSIGIPNGDIKNFVDPIHWLYYFPPIAINDLKRFGLHTDWRRSFITTDVNPFYDSFIRWQFNRLRSLSPSKIQFGERYTIYSPLDGQPCMDHDRSAGEGVGVKEYTAIKLQVDLDHLAKTPVAERYTVRDSQLRVGEKLTSAEFTSALAGRKLFLVAATLRPETMYGQTNCFVGPDLEYGVFVANDNEAYVCTERSARNMAFQNIFKQKGVVKKIFDFSGTDLIGIPLSAPLAAFERVYTLPMEGVLAAKGTGVVTSVPSDAPDDYVTLMELLKKAEYYGVSKDWISPYLPLKPIILTPNYGDLAAVEAVQKLKILSPKDKKQLAEAKDMVYTEGFYKGVLLVGEHAGKPVQEAKPLVRQILIDQGMAFAYCEPDGVVVSRSGDECVVTLAAQWYMDYGEESWKKLAKQCLAQMNTHSEETRNAFEKTLDWLTQWACSRSFGLGSRLPWDRDWLIESLSDSTIYMAYYTVAHILQDGVLDGSKRGSANIAPEHMTDEVWSYILAHGPTPKETIIPMESLDKMRAEFEYFYPLDLRSSGKDLINNHLTFFLYNHTAVFPPEMWPKGVRANGHLLLDGEKMSKSTGNFMTLRDALDKYGADATRFALADAGDGLEDANFVPKTANDAILKLYTEKEWIEETFAAAEKGDLRTGELSWFDRVFSAEMDLIVAQADRAYQDMLYRDALKASFYDLQNVRNEYRKAVTGQGINLTGLENEVFEGMHRDLVTRFVELEALLMSPIVPHWSEHIWRDILKRDGLIVHARWPKVSPVDKSLLAAATYIRELGAKIRSAEDALARRKNKKGAAASTDATAVTDANAARKLHIYVATAFPEWQEQAVAILRQTWDAASQSLAGGEKELLAKAGLLKDKRIMPFIALIKKTVETAGVSALDRQLVFSEPDTLRANIDYVRRDLTVLRISSIRVMVKEDMRAGVDGIDDDDIKKAESALPGSPTYRIL